MNQLPQQTVKRIEESAAKEWPPITEWRNRGLSIFPYDINETHREAYISGATSECHRNIELVKALEEIIEWSEGQGSFYDITEIAKQALKNYQQ